jgi:DcuC family C4-dicarboxylate transporter
VGNVIAFTVVIWTGYLLVKRFKPQSVLFVAGLTLMFVALALGLGQVLPAKQSTGSLALDAFEFIRSTLSSRAAGLGMNIMAVGGFARYMDHIGASRALVRVAMKPLLALNAPYLVMAGTWVIGMLLGLAINSAAGLAMLLMVTAFPILVNLGVSRLSATAAIATTLCLDWSPGDSGTLLSAGAVGIEPAVYWIKYQVPIAAAVIPVVAVLHYLTQRWMDKRDGHVVAPQTFELSADEKAKAATPAPAWYAILPVIPLALILTFSPLCVTTIKMDIIKAMIIGLAVAMIVEFARSRDGKKVCADIQVFFDGLGMQMANVVTLIVAGETFARGLITIGAVDSLIHSAQAVGVGAAGTILLMVSIIVVMAILMGSGNAAFVSFAALAPTIAAKMSIAPAAMLLPMHFAASTARAMSPITAAIVVSASMGGVSPFILVKRTAIPMIGSLLTLVVTDFALFY